MFYERITSTPLANEDADLYFAAKIAGDSFGDDRSFLSTLRALLPSRMEEGDHVTLSIMRNQDIALIKEYVESALSSVNDRLFLISVDTRDADERKGNIASVVELLKGKGYTEVEKVGIFFKSAFEAHCLVDESSRSTFIVTERQDTCKHHLLQACVPLFFPWFFKPLESGKVVTPDESTFFRCFMEAKPDEYRAWIGKFAQQYDMDEVVLRAKLKGVETAFRERQITTLTDEVKSLESQIAEYRSYIRERLQSRDDAMIRLNGLRYMAQQNNCEDEIMEYFLANRHVKLASVEGSRIEFFAFGNLLDCDSDIVESYLNNHSCFLYDVAAGRGYDKDVTDRVMRDVFLNGVIKLRFVAKYYLDLVEGAGGMRGDKYQDWSGYMPNPHIRYHRCLGSYEYVLSDIMRAGNYIAVFEQCIASATSLNWADGVVFEEFIKDFFSDKYVCLEMPDGSVVSFHTAYKQYAE